MWEWETSSWLFFLTWRQELPSWNSHKYLRLKMSWAEAINLVVGFHDPPMYSRKKPGSHPRHLLFASPSIPSVSSVTAVFDPSSLMRTSFPSLAFSQTLQHIFCNSDFQIVFLSTVVDLAFCLFYFAFAWLFFILFAVGMLTSLQLECLLPFCSENLP